MVLKCHISIKYTRTSLSTKQENKHSSNLCPSHNHPNITFSFLVKFDRIFPAYLSHATNQKKKKKQESISVFDIKVKVAFNIVKKNRPRHKLVFLAAMNPTPAHKIHVCLCFDQLLCFVTLWCDWSLCQTGVLFQRDNFVWRGRREGARSAHGDASSRQRRFYFW